MGFLLLLGIVVAIASIIPILKSSLRWEATLGLGILSSSTAGIALLLDYLTPLVIFEWAADQTVTGLPLFLSGPSASILGKGYGFFLIAFCWGITLIVAGLVKRSKKIAVKKATEEPEEPIEPYDETQRILDELKNEIANLRESFEDPKRAGADDATKAGGPFPKKADTEPLQGGYEGQIRAGFETLGTTFAQTTVTNLKASIIQALSKLGDIKNKLSNQTYSEIAHAKYNQNNTAIAPYTIKKNKKSLTTTTQNRDEFIASLKLKRAERPNWADDNITTRKTLVIWGIAFALLEFVISWFFLKDQIGKDAIQIAGYAVAIIFILAFLAGFLFRFMRRNRLPYTRMLSFIGYGIVCFFIFCGLGLLLNYREFDASTDVASRFDTILSGYNSLMSNLTNVVVFLINLMALALFYWKVLHFFDKFEGYSQVDKPFRHAEKQWHSMYNEAQEKISDALNYTDEKVIEDDNETKECFSDMLEKTTILGNIKTIISGAYAIILRPAYNEDVATYRDSNCRKRVLQANPAPAYFQDEHRFCDIEQHFEENENIEIFFTENKEKLDQAQENNQFISAEQRQWQTDRLKLNIQLNSESNALIDNARDGTP